jgi:uncharacterized protein (TIGR00375 family)
LKFYTDLHLHSRYSRATSKDSGLEHLALWAQIKGIQVLGTGDFTHPRWFAELQEKLEPAEEGLFKLKDEYLRTTRDQVPESCRAPVRFMLTVEISNIYKKTDKVRKVHHCVFAPGFAAAEKIRGRLEAIGNINSDGRPILGLDSRNLLEIVLESDPLSYLIPAHIWTPWFSVLGSKGGFDRVDDCFGDLADNIFAVETGLSSDPPMNWRVGQLDKYALVSNGDAHSPSKVGREATIFDTEMSYPAIYRALKDDKDKGLIGTVEFFPEEGKYHYDGLRASGVCLHPRETVRNRGLCPKTGKPVTVGVMARVEELADHPEGRKPPRWRPYHSLVPLPEIIADARGVGPNTRSVNTVYRDMLNKLGNEYFILFDAPVDKIARAAGPMIAEGVRRVRSGQIDIRPGYDGVFGEVRIYSPGERATAKEQMTLFT